MKKKMCFILILIAVCSILLFIHSYIGMDKATSVPKALLMKIRPLPWEEIYWDEENQILKLTVIEQTASGEESRCLRIFTLMPSGLLMGGREFRTIDSLGITNAFVAYDIDDGDVKIFDQRTNGLLVAIKISDICYPETEFDGIYPVKVYYELGDETIIHVVLGYKTAHENTIMYHESIPEIIAVINYTHDPLTGMETFEIGKFEVADQNT